MQETQLPVDHVDEQVPDEADPLAVEADNFAVDPLVRVIHTYRPPSQTRFPQKDRTTALSPTCCHLSAPGASSEARRRCQLAPGRYVRAARLLRTPLLRHSGE